jgi:hypothetical protein
MVGHYELTYSSVVTSGWVNCEPWIIIMVLRCYIIAPGTSLLLERNAGKERGKGVIAWGVWRKPNPKMRVDEQEPDMRRDTLRTRRHVTVKFP